MQLATRLAHRAFDPAGELAGFMASLEDEGAVASFVGVARRTGADGKPIDRLFLDHHPRLTERSLDEIGRAAAERFRLGSVLVIHRCGEILPGEPIVLVAAASRHRRAAFQAADYLMDRLKTEAVFWKREDGLDGSRWIEPTDADHRDRTRWSEQCPE